ncbi:MAG TPA: polymer-forming cytoskeletal protein [Symbiobacteriaceae bacterium]
MFASAKKPAESVNYGKVQSIIGEGTEIKGAIHSTGVVRIDGYLEGTIEHSGELIVGPKGRLVATVKSTDLAIAGELRGEVEVEGKLELLAGARLFGDIRCGHLVVHEGAIFNGRSLMAPNELAAEKARD